MSKLWVPHDYQLEAIEFGVTRGCAGIMLDPGLGKTSVAMAIYNICWQAEDVDRVLVIAPLLVAKTTWPNEVLKWKDFNSIRIANLCEKTMAERRAALRDRSFDMYVINPESLGKVLQLPEFDKAGIDMLIVDESTRFKNSQSQRFKELRKKLHLFKRRLILTGTPVPNGLEDIFSQVYILDEGKRLGKYITHFRMEYMYQKPGDPYSYYMRPGVDVQIYDKIKDVLLRMRASDYLDMPKLINNFIEVELPPNLKQKYKELETDFLTLVDEETIYGVNSSAAGMKCRQFANGFVYINEPDPYSEKMLRRSVHLHEVKLDALELLIDEMQGRPLLVGYEFTEDAQRIMARFPDAVNLGQEKDKAKVVESFNRGEIPLLLAHPASAGHGLNLQVACHEVCWFGVPWDLELYQQFIARIWRQGQTSPVCIVHHIVCRKTRDQKAMEALQMKDLTQEKFNLAIAESV